MTRLRPPPVKHTIDFDRITALPRRTISRDDAEAWADVFTARLAKEPRRGQSPVRLLWQQGVALAELTEQHGACCFLPVGAGKTLIFDLAPVLLGSQRPVAIMSSVLRDKTWDDFARHADRWRRCANPWTIITREELALEKNQDLLFRLRPDFVALEESDEYCNLSRGAPARIDRYRRATWDDPGVVFCAFSGTPSRFSIMATWHLLVWCLREGAPVPLSHTEALGWAAALDETTRNAGMRPAPGPLGRSRKDAIAWYAARLRETPGVIIIDGDSCDQPLTIRTRYARDDDALNEAFAHFKKYGETPGGVAVSDDSARNPLSKWRLDAQIGIGLCSYWDPAPPEAWRMAYRAKAKFVRDTIAMTQRRTHGRICDTEGQVLREYPDATPVRDWQSIRDTFTGVTRVRWLSRSGLDSVRDWLDEDDAPGVVWCGSVEFAHALAAETHLPYYGAEGRTAAGAMLCRAKADTSIICSWCANKKGFNLQGWARALIVMPPQSAKWLEQIIGRHHRAFQDSPVTIDILLSSGGTADAIETAIREALFAKSTVSLTQKILRATVQRGALPPITEANAFRWACRSHPLPANERKKSACPSPNDPVMSKSLQRRLQQQRGEARPDLSGRGSRGRERLCYP